MESNDTIHVALASNHRYMPGLKATLASMLLSTKHKDRIQFHIFADGLTDADKSEVDELVKRFGYENSIDYRIADMAKIVARFRPYRNSHTSYLRLFFPELLPEVDWVVWADADTLWFRDLAEFWSKRDNSVSLVWSRDMVDSQKRAGRDFSVWHAGYDYKRYACSGIILMNLKRLRKNDFINKCFAFEEKWGTPPSPDQDMLNEICCDDAKLLDCRWGCMQPDPNWQNGVVLHCVGIGEYFNSGYNGWLPANEIWFRFYREVVPPPPTHTHTNEYFHRVSCIKKIVWFLLGASYPSLFAAKLLSLPFRRYLTEYNLWRTMYLCWLRRKPLWHSN